MTRMKKRRKMTKIMKEVSLVFQMKMSKCHKMKTYQKKNNMIED